MQPSTPLTPATTIPVPEIDSDAPVAVIPMASVAPLEGPPDGDRINTFALVPKNSSGGFIRDSVLSEPMKCVLAAFALGFLTARVLR